MVATTDSLLKFLGIFTSRISLTQAYTKIMYQMHMHKAVLAALNLINDSCPKQNLHKWQLCQPHKPCSNQRIQQILLKLQNGREWIEPFVYNINCTGFLKPTVRSTHPTRIAYLIIYFHPSTHPIPILRHISVYQPLQLHQPGRLPHTAHSKYILFMSTHPTHIYRTPSPHTHPPTPSLLRHISVYLPLLLHQPGRLPHTTHSK